MLNPETLAASAPLIERLVHNYLLANRDQLVTAAKAIDRAYLKRFESAGLTYLVDNPTTTEMIAAIAGAFIDEGLAQTE